MKKEELFEWIKNSTKGLNCVVYGCKRLPVVMCGCSYHYCEYHTQEGTIPRELDPHTTEFAEKWGWEDFKRFMYG